MYRLCRIKTSFFFQTTGRHPPGARRETTEVKTRKCWARCLADLSAQAVLTSGMRAGTRIEAELPEITAVGCFFAPRSDREAKTTKQRSRWDTTASCAIPARPIRRSTSGIGGFVD